MQKSTIKLGKFLCVIYFFLILFMPDFLRGITTIYSVSASMFIDRYPWLSYSLSYLEIPCILFVIFLQRKNKYIIDVRPLVIFVLLKEVLLYLLGINSIFTYNDYALVLGLLVGAGCYYALTNTCEAREEQLLDSIIILNFVFQVLFIITGRVMTDGRYSTLGSNVGEIGSFCSQYLLYYLFCRKNTRFSYFTIVSCIGGLIFSASRTNIILALLFIMLFAYDIKKGFNRNPQKVKTVGMLVCLAMLLIPMMSMIAQDKFNSLFERSQGALKSLFQTDTSYLSADSSFNDRRASITAGLAILSEKPLGISSSTIDLQVQTIEKGYFYFPHSFLLTYYLLWSVFSVCIVLLLMHLLFVSIKKKNNLSILLLYIIILFIFYGAPIINCKTYFWYLCVFSLAKRELDVKNFLWYSKRTMPIDNYE